MQPQRQTTSIVDLTHDAHTQMSTNNRDGPPTKTHTGIPHAPAPQGGSPVPVASQRAGWQAQLVAQAVAGPQAKDAHGLGPEGVITSSTASASAAPYKEMWGVPRWHDQWGTVYALPYAYAAGPATVPATANASHPSGLPPSHPFQKPLARLSSVVSGPKERTANAENAEFANGASNGPNVNDATVQQRVVCPLPRMVASVSAQQPNVAPQNQPTTQALAPSSTFQVPVYGPTPAHAPSRPRQIRIGETPKSQPSAAAKYQELLAEAVATGRFDGGLPQRFFFVPPNPDDDTIPEPASVADVLGEKEPKGAEGHWVDDARMVLDAQDVTRMNAVESFARDLKREGRGLARAVPVPRPVKPERELDGIDWIIRESGIVDWEADVVKPPPLALAVIRSRYPVEEEKDFSDVDVAAPSSQTAVNESTGLVASSKRKRSLAEANLDTDSEKTVGAKKRRVDENDNVNALQAGAPSELANLKGEVHRMRAGKWTELYEKRKVGDRLEFRCLVPGCSRMDTVYFDSAHVRRHMRAQHEELVG